MVLQKQEPKLHNAKEEGSCVVDADSQAAWGFWGRTETLSLPSGLKGQEWLCDTTAWDEEQTP